MLGIGITTLLVRKSYFRSVMDFRIPLSGSQHLLSLFQGGEITVTTKVKNTGKAVGARVVQVYVTQQNPSIRRPNKELKRFSKVYLEKGEEKEVIVEMELKYAAGFWDEARGKWICEKDVYKVVVANSSVCGEGSHSAEFEVGETFWWKGV